MSKREYYNNRKGSGTNFEYSLTNDLIRAGYTAKRLGGTTTNMPDIAATKDDIHITFEVKKTRNKNIIYIPSEQILRCFQFLKMYNLYPKKYIVLGFNFLTRTQKSKSLLSNEKYFFLGNKLIPYLIYNLKETGDKRHPYVFYYHMISCNIYEEIHLHYNNDFKPKERINLPYCYFTHHKQNLETSVFTIGSDADLDQEIDYLENTKKYINDLSLIH